MSEYDFDKDNEDYNLVQKFWYKNYMLYQNCGIDSEYVGEYNGITLFEKIGKENEEMREVLHATLEGSRALSIEEMKEKIINYEKNIKKILPHLEELSSEEDIED